MSIPKSGKIWADCGGSSVVECLLPKEKVGGSNPLHRSSRCSLMAKHYFRKVVMWVRFPPLALIQNVPLCAGFFESRQGVGIESSSKSGSAPPLAGGALGIASRSLLRKA